MNPMDDPAQRDEYISKQKEIGQGIIDRLRQERREYSPKKQETVIIGVSGQNGDIQAVDNQGG